MRSQTCSNRKHRVCPVASGWCSGGYFFVCCDGILFNSFFLQVVLWPWKIWLLDRSWTEALASMFRGLTFEKIQNNCSQLNNTLCHNQCKPLGAGLLPDLVQWSTQWGLDSSASPPLYQDGEVAGPRAFKVLILKGYLSPFQEERLRRFAAAVYPLLCQLWCADLRPEVVIASCQRWSNTRDKINVFVLFRCAVCSALCFCGSVLSMAFQTSPMGLGMQRCSILSFSFWYQFSSISSPGGQCSILMKRPEDNLSSIVI